MSNVDEENFLSIAITNRNYGHCIGWFYIFIECLRPMFWEFNSIFFFCYKNEEESGCLPHSARRCLIRRTRNVRTYASYEPEGM